MATVTVEAAVAAIDPPACLTALTLAALALPGMAPKAVAAAPVDSASTDFLYARYEESGGRMEIDVYSLNGVAPVSGSGEMAAGWVTDVMAGASPVLNIPASKTVISGASAGRARIGLTNDTNRPAFGPPVEVLSSASIRDTRHGLNINGSYLFDQMQVGLSAAGSHEKDYQSYSITTDGQYESKDKMNTFNLALGGTWDKIEPVSRPLSERKWMVNSSAGWTRIIDKLSLFQVSMTYDYNDGYLSNPYKKVYIQDGGDHLPGLVNAFQSDVFYDNRPGTRHQFALLGRYNRAFPDLNAAALHLDYRFYADSWNIRSHTVEASWHQPVGDGWMVVADVRYYSQNEASFYQPYFFAPRSDGVYSSDYRLAGFGVMSGGVMLSKSFFDQLKVTLGFEYYEHAAALKLGGASQSGFADFSYLLATFGLNYVF